MKHSLKAITKIIGNTEKYPKPAHLGLGYFSVYRSIFIAATFSRSAIFSLAPRAENQTELWPAGTGSIGFSMFGSILRVEEESVKKIATKKNARAYLGSAWSFCQEK